MDDLSEKEQLDQMRYWWSEYGSFVIGGIVIGASLLLGINYYQNKTLQSQLNASAAYEILINHVSAGRLDDAKLTEIEISMSYRDTIYVAQAGLAMARLYMDKNRDEAAADALLGVIDGSSDNELKNIARLRLARIYLYQDKPEEAINLLINQEGDAFSAIFGEVLGDAYTMLGRTAEAADSYQRVLMNPLSEATVDQQLVKWKALDLPELEPAIKVMTESEIEEMVEVHRSEPKDAE
ncbi:MAG: tetratricopeptide repeat protein [Woeseiaceae bacterium]|nr:tetratricopeptide repeat protein [Woeseiaceae bacterium]